MFDTIVEKKKNSNARMPILLCIVVSDKNTQNSDI